MTNGYLKPLGLGGIMDQTFRIYARNFLPLTLLVLLCDVPAHCLIAYDLWYPTQDFAQKIPWMLVYLVFSIPQVYSHLVITYLVSDLTLGQKTPWGALHSRARRNFGKFFGTVFLVGLWVFLGLCLMVIPGILWSFSLALAATITAVEGITGHQALERSKQLVKGQRKLVVNTIVVGWLAIQAAALAVGFGGGAVGILAGLSEDSPWIQFVGSLMGSFLTPLGQIFPVLLYYQVRIRSEAFDLEHSGQQWVQPKIRG